MELDWTTFILEIINFFVLIWILQRFFYKPVQNVIAKRKEMIDKILTEAKAARVQADDLNHQYQKRLEDWGEERARARDELSKELDAERARRMAALEAALADEREKNKTLEQRRVAELQKVLQKKAVGRGADFATKLVARFSCPELEAKLIASLCDDLAGLPPKETQRIQSAYQREAKPRIVVTSVFTVSQTLRDLLHARLTSLVGREIAVEFVVDSSLISGVRVDLASWVLQANIRDELKFFEEAELHAA